MDCMAVHASCLVALPYPFLWSRGGTRGSISSSVHYALQTLCTVHCTQCTVHSVQCTGYCSQCTVYCSQCTVYCAQCTMYNCTCICIQCTVYTNRDHVGGLVDQSILLHTPHFRPCVLYTVLFTVYSVLYTVCSVRYTVCSVRYTVYSVPYTVYNVHVHNVQCTQIVTKWGAAGSISSSVHSAFQTLCVLYTVYSRVDQLSCFWEF